MQSGRLRQSRADDYVVHPSLCGKAEKRFDSVKAARTTTSSIHPHRLDFVQAEDFVPAEKRRNDLTPSKQSGPTESSIRPQGHQHPLYRLFLTKKGGKVEKRFDFSRRADVRAAVAKKEKIF